MQKQHASHQVVPQSAKGCGITVLLSKTTVLPFPLVGRVPRFLKMCLAYGPGPVLCKQLEGIFCTKTARAAQAVKRPNVKGIPARPSQSSASARASKPATKPLHPWRSEDAVAVQTWTPAAPSIIICFAHNLPLLLSR